MRFQVGEPKSHTSRNRLNEDLHYFVGITNYIASKYAVNGLTKQGAVEYAEYRIRVNAIAPAWHSGTALSSIRSSAQTTLEQDEREKHLLARTPMGRRGRVEELQGLVLFLASDASSYITGQVIASDGGWTVH